MSEVSRQLFLMHVNDKLAALEEQQEEEQPKKSNWKKYALGAAALAGTAAAAYAGRGHLKQLGSKLFSQGGRAASEAASGATSTAGGSSRSILKRYKQLMSGSRLKQIDNRMTGAGNKALKYQDTARKYAANAENLLAKRAKSVADAEAAFEAVGAGSPGKFTQFLNRFTKAGRQRNADYINLLTESAANVDAAKAAQAVAKADGGLYSMLTSKAADAAKKSDRYYNRFMRLDKLRGAENAKVWGARIGTGVAGLGATYGIGRATGVIDAPQFGKPAEEEKKPEKKLFGKVNLSLDDENTRNALYGTAGGALLGSGLGYLAGDGKGALLGGLAGAGLGGYTGYNANKWLEK